MSKSGVFKVIGILFAGLSLGYLGLMIYIIKTTDRCRMLESVVSSKNKHEASLWKAYLTRVSPFRVDEVCGPGVEDRRPLTVLTSACVVVKNYDSCELMFSALRASGADFNANDLDREFGFTPLHEAVLGADEALVKMLIGRGARASVPATGTRYFNKTPLDLVFILQQSQPGDIEKMDRIQKMLQNSK